MSTMPRRNVVPDAFNLRRPYQSSTWVQPGADHRHLDPRVFDVEDRLPVGAQESPRRPHHQRVAAERWARRSAQSLLELVPRTPARRPRKQKSGRGRVNRLRQWHLGDAQEQVAPTCKPFFYYTRSLLYLVLESFEGGKRTPILGMEKTWYEIIGALKLNNVQAWSAPRPASSSAAHCSFDDQGVKKWGLCKGSPPGAKYLNRVATHYSRTNYAS